MKTESKIFTKQDYDQGIHISYMVIRDDHYFDFQNTAIYNDEIPSPETKTIMKLKRKKKLRLAPKLKLLKQQGGENTSNLL
jgi:hypothetical protein